MNKRLIVWLFTLASFIFVSLVLLAVSLAQSSTLTVTMKVGEVRVLEDGSKIGLTKGQNGDIVVTLTRTSASDEGDITRIVPQLRTSRVRLGTYAARETTETVVSAMFGKGLHSYPTVRIKIIDVDNSGTMSADFVRWDAIAHLKGTVDSSGNVLLTGYLDDGSGNEWKLTLNATIRGNELFDGTYNMKTLNGVETRGVFKVAQLQ